MSASPFIVVPWQTPFLPALIPLALERTGGDIGGACFIFPHTRPARYMTDLLRDDARIRKPCVLPRMEAVTALFSLARSGLAARPAVSIGLLDQVALLLGCVRETRSRAAAGSLLHGLPLDDSRRFFPWGVRLANLMEEFFQHNRLPEDYSHMEGQVSPFAAALLENLAVLHGRYMEALDARGWTTPGYDAFRTARAARDPGFVLSLPGLEGKTLFLAGFHALTGAQDVFFRHLWQEKGALVCLHADPETVSGSPHWSCADLVRWAGRWRTGMALHGEAPDPDRRPRILFRAGYDVHSQLAELRRELAGDAPPPAAGLSGTAVVLPDTSLLLPVLHHLPDAGVNISMGYPLARSPLFRLIESILRLQETRREGVRPLYHWKGLIDLLRHPYLKMLEIPDGQPFRHLLHQAERIVRAGRRFADPVGLPEQAELAQTALAGREGAVPDGRAAPLRELFIRVLRATTGAWERIESPADLAEALAGLADLLREYGRDLWERFPIDAECLHRLEHSVIPQLAGTALKEESLPAPTLFAVLRELLREERVPFEAYPLVGTQVLGVLETRLLQFDRLFVLDLTEDRLPGSAGHDPLLPDPLRPLAGLPPAHGRESVAAYTFFRLLAAAREVTLYWQEGVEPQGLADGKKVRSRFVEELIWAEECRRGAVLSPEDPARGGEDGPLRCIACALPPVPRDRRSIPATAAVRERVQRILKGAVSPSLLDTYLHCPARFFYERIGRISPAPGVNEGEDPLGTGILLHETLRNYFSARKDRPVRASETEEKALRDLFLTELAASPLSGTLPADDRILLEEAGPVRLARLLSQQEGRIPRLFEEPVAAAILVDGRTRRLAGTLDRVDEADGNTYVLDYKTGSIPRIGPDVWQDAALWRELDAPGGDGPQNDALLAAVAEQFASVQLPAYLYMFMHGSGRDVHDALYVPLKSGLEESPLIGDDISDEDRTAILCEKIPSLLRFLLRHMERSVSFRPRENKNCRWCPYQKMCIVASG